MKRNTYPLYIKNKSQLNNNYGFLPIFIPDFLYDFQKYLIDWGLQKGKCAEFADCGLGKTPMQLVWAQNILQKTNKPVLILTPLAVSSQTLREADKFNIYANKSSTGKVHDITITNYERLHYFDPSSFSGVVCDESSILKNFDGKRKAEITQFMRKVKYRSLWTATAAPNDYIELGTSSEALGYIGYIDMLNKYFKNNQNNSSTKQHFGKKIKWRFKGYAEDPFWLWVSTWAKAIRMPSDLGFNNTGFTLPELIEETHILKDIKPPDGVFFNLPAIGLREERAERKRTLKKRCEKAAELVSHKNPAIIWCNTNDEGDLLEHIIPGALQVAGKHSDTIKEERLMGFANKDFRVLITKPKIGAWGLNYQHCSHIVNFPTHSYEQYYQSIRRCWRFGQKNAVKVDNIITEADKFLFENLNRKAKSADKMFEKLVQFMNGTVKEDKIKGFNNKEKLPIWLKNN